MSNEIWHNLEFSGTLYALVHKKADDKVNIIGTNNFEVWNDANIATYALAMTDNGGGYYTVDFPAGITDTEQQAYRVTIRIQAGGSPVADESIDLPESQGEIFWDGSEEVDVGTINISNQTVTNIYNDDFQAVPITVITLP